MSAISTPELEHSLNVLVIMLSISVDESSVNRVGLVIKGKHLTSFCQKLICIIVRVVSVADRLPPTLVRNKSYKYEPEFILWSTIVISTRQRRMGHVRARRSRRNRLCRNGGSNASCSLLSPAVTCRSSLFVDRDAVVFPRRWFHFA